MTHRRTTMTPPQPIKPSPRSLELERLRRELLRRIVDNESRRHDPRRTGAK
jgi:hypothetical protein